jgi:uroporphyrinogen III methyltransferase / synthase
MTDPIVLRLATRRSQLALTQSRWVVRQLEQARPDVRVELVEVVTTGDRVQDRLLREVGGKQLFVKEIEEALLEGRADLAVHSLKDVPTELPSGLTLLAIPAREDARDVLIARTPLVRFEELPQGARVGTASLRRQAFLLRARPDLQIQPLRGNVDTRIRKLREGNELDAIVLAEAGLRRTGRVDVERLLLDPRHFVPAVGQGALALEAVAARPDLGWIVAALDDPLTRLAVEAERAFLAHLGGGCSVPIAAHALWVRRGLALTGCVADESGDVIQLEAQIEVELDDPAAPEAVARAGRRLAERVLLAGGAAVVERMHEASGLVDPALADTQTQAPELVLPPPRRGTVYLVGAGPGELGLITVRGKGLLETADAVVYDFLANDDLLSPLRPEAERHFVGKRPGQHTLTQDEIGALLVELARAHDVVVRLKGGDPFIFGRGGEEAAALAAAGVPFEVVPGITSAIAAPAYAGVPLTHRGVAGSVVFVTGHGAGAGAPEPDWQAVAGIDTIVILMGARRLAENMKALAMGGRDLDDPVLIVEWASFPRQRSVLATVGTAAAAMARAGLEAPAVVVVGPVAKLHEQLEWYGRRPLFGKRVLVTRSKGQASSLSTRLFQAGAVPVELPALEICAVDGDEQRRLDEALLSLATYDWVVFTSHNGVLHTFERLHHLQLDARALAGCALAVIGSATADVLRRHGLSADLVPDRFDAEGLVQALAPHVDDSTSVLILRAREAREELTSGLRARGAYVDDVPAYYSREPVDLAQRLDEVLAHRLDLITLASTKTAENLTRAAGTHLDTLLQVPVACIGPVTRRAAERLGFEVVVQAHPYTLDALLDGIAEWAALDGEGG